MKWKKVMEGLTRQISSEIFVPKNLPQPQRTNEGNLRKELQYDKVKLLISTSEFFTGLELTRDQLNFACSHLEIFHFKKENIILQATKASEPFLFILISGKIANDNYNDYEERKNTGSQKAKLTNPKYTFWTLGDSVIPQLEQAITVKKIPKVKCLTDCTFVYFDQKSFRDFLKKLKTYTKKRKVQFAISNPAFSSISEKFIPRFIQCFHEREFKKNQILLKEKEPIKYIYVVISGEFTSSVHVSRNNTNNTNNLKAPSQSNSNKNFISDKLLQSYYRKENAGMQIIDTFYGSGKWIGVKEAILKIKCEKTVKCASLKARAYAITTEEFKSKILIFPSVKEFFTNIYKITFPNEDLSNLSNLSKNNDSQNKMPLGLDNNIDKEKADLPNEQNEVNGNEMQINKFISLRQNLETKPFKKLILGPCNKKWYKPLQLICNSRFLKENSQKGSGFNKFNKFNNEAFKKRSRDYWSKNFLTKFITLSGNMNPVINEFAQNFKIGSSNKGTHPSSSNLTQENQDHVTNKKYRNQGKFLIWNFTQTNILL